MKGTCQYFRFKISVNHCKKRIAMYDINKAFHDIVRAPLLVDLFLYSFESDFIQGLLKKNEKKLSQSFNSTFRYIDDVLSLNNFRFW